MNESSIPENQIPQAVDSSILVGDTIQYDKVAYAAHMLYMTVNPGTAKVVGINDNYFAIQLNDTIYSGIPKNICWK